MEGKPEGADAKVVVDQEMLFLPEDDIEDF